MHNLNGLLVVSAQEVAEIQAESIGWQRLEEGVYLHQGSADNVVQIVGSAHADMADMNVVWVK